jgi:hypothetical protein
VAQRLLLADQICLELTVHAQIEEENFHLEPSSALKAENLLDAAKVENMSARDLIAHPQLGSEAYSKSSAKLEAPSE